MRMQPPGSDKPYDGSRLKRFLDVDKSLLEQMEKKRERKVALKNRLG